MTELVLQPHAAASCQAFNTYVSEHGWTDFAGQSHPHLAGGTTFEIRWNATWIADKQTVDGGVELSTEQVLPGWFAAKRMGRLEWVAPGPVVAVSGRAIQEARCFSARSQ
jgi:hypothetical protein